jgi:hypothetical protein
VRTSPDGTKEALIWNYNITVRDADTGKNEVALSTDGSEGDAYDFATIAWSPDSKKIAASRVRPGYRREVHYVESSPADQLQPKHTTNVYAKPGDALALPQPVILDVASKTELVVDNTLFPNPYELSRFQWRGRIHAGSRSSTTSAATRSIASSRRTPRPARRARSFRKSRRHSSTTARRTAG